LITLFFSDPLEWRNELSVSGVSFWNLFEQPQPTELSDVGDLDLLELQEGIEHTVVELTEVSDRVSLGKVSLLEVIDGQVGVDFNFVGSNTWISNSSEIFMIRSARKSIDEFSVVLSLSELFTSSWVKVTEIVL
jgi:hypothetical protein